jgi:hypothetical protein
VEEAVKLAPDLKKKRLGFGAIVVKDDDGR